MHSQGSLRAVGWITGDGKLVGISAYTRSPQIQRLEGRTKAWTERIDVNAPWKGVLSWWVKIFSSVKRAQPFEVFLCLSPTFLLCSEDTDSQLTTIPIAPTVCKAL